MMGFIMKTSYPRLLLNLISLLCLLCLSGKSFAVPSYARQTGENCVACHTSFPELTPFGREFKLNGYTLGQTQWLPVAIMAQFSATSIKNNTLEGGDKLMPKTGQIQLDGGSVFFAGKVNDHLGGFIQWTYDNHSDVRSDGSTVHHSNLDNTDIRLVNNYTLLDKNLLVGLTLNNNPGVQDVWNSSPAWGFPYTGSSAVGVPGPTFSTMIEGALAQTSAGLGVYFWWDRHLYGELSLYGNADKLFKPLSAGTTLDPSMHIQGRNNPYWRLAWNQEWGADSLMIGTYGMKIDITPNDSGLKDRYTDIAIDTQYQHISDPSIFTLQSTFIHEDQRLDASDAGKNTLNSFKFKASYLYDRKYGATVGFFDINGTSNINYSYDANPSAKPNSRGYMAEFDYNYTPNLRFLLQYTAYTKLDELALVDSSRRPSDNNTLFLATWFAY
jgi:hypothetical protein